MQGRGELRQFGLAGDETHRATHRAGAVQGTLWPAQYFDVIEVEHPRVNRVGKRYVIDVEAGDVIARNATDRNGTGGTHSVPRGREGQIGNLRRVIDELGDRLLLEGSRAERRDRHWHGLLILRALLGRDDHLLQTLHPKRGGGVCPLGRRARDHQHAHSGETSLRIVCHRPLPDFNGQLQVVAASVLRDSARTPGTGAVSASMSLLSTRRKCTSGASARIASISNFGSSSSVFCWRSMIALSSMKPSMRLLRSEREIVESSPS